ncbi:MAG TPA: DEAD/DEAH box helicase family protein [Gammaproteobacteria bacterium]|nr:DEAD/DEAH box helicase family protein [Gammaproteobacteria bacterium]
MQLRWYQDEAVYSIFDYFERGNVGNPIIAMPTGTGKSFVIAEFLRRVFAMWARQRVMMLTHVKELIEQNAQELLNLWPTAPLGIYSAGLKQKDIMLPIIFGGIASVVKNVQAFGFRDLVIIDECHLLSPKDASMYQTAIAALKLVNPYLKVIGLSATPFRLKQGYLTDDGLFTDICYDITGCDAFNRLIAEGYISPLTSKRTSIEIDVSNVGIIGGEFNQKQADAAVDKEEIIYAAVKESVQMGYDRGSWLAFASSIKNAEHVASMLQSFGIQAAAVHSDLDKIDKNENTKRIRDFKNGYLRCLVSMNKMTTGVNHPPIDFIIDLQPTCSPGKHVQKYGRGTRPSPATGKRNCLVGDFAGNTRRNGPINDPRIPGKPGKGNGDLPIRICDCGVYNHAAARFCGGGSSSKEGILRGGCGMEFTFATKLFRTASEEAILRSDAPQVEYYDVTKVLYHLHKKTNAEGVLISPPSMKVSYFCGLQMFNEWVCLEHPGFPGKRARDWWRQRHNEEPPVTTFEALRRCSELKQPRRIRVWVNKKNPEVLGHEF